MNLDELDAIERAVVDLARDLLHTSERCHPHDPELAAKFLSKADEICRDFDIDRALIDPMLISQSDQMPAETITEVNIVESADLGAENTASARALNHILDKQREVIGDQFWDATSDVRSEQLSRSPISSISQWFGRLQSA
ncbi:MAG: hypothetical protein OEU92_07030 [Alphaproteobacteria bacterium]|nr:hypothetical protein [Alphaproteobacteria bacterium]